MTESPRGGVQYCSAEKVWRQTRGLMRRAGRGPAGSTRENLWLFTGGADDPLVSHSQTPFPSSNRVPTPIECISVFPQSRQEILASAVYPDPSLSPPCQRISLQSFGVCRRQRQRDSSTLCENCVEKLGCGPWKLSHRSIFMLSEKSEKESLRAKPTVFCVRARVRFLFLRLVLRKSS